MSTDIGGAVAEACVLGDFPQDAVRRCGTGYNVTCPHCGGKFKLNVNVAKGLFRCAKCDYSGNVVQLHMGMADISSYKDALADLEKQAGNPVCVEKAKKYENQAERKPAPLWIRNETYTRLLDSLTLSRKHRQNLRKRGLSDEEIDRLGYKTYPKIGFSYLHCPNAPIPGYASQMLCQQKDDCFMIPVRYRHGEVSMIQLRHDTPARPTDDFSRYTNLSSSHLYDKGGVTTTGCENIHYAGFDFTSDKTPEKIYLTEGALKADVASYLAEQLYGRKTPFLAVLGVNNVKQLPAELAYLKEHGTQGVCLALDMDYRTKPEVSFNSL